MADKEDVNYSFIKVFHIVLRLQLYTLYLILNNIWNFSTKIYLKFSGTCDSSNGKIRIRSIYARHKLDPEELSKSVDFVLSVGYLEEQKTLIDPHWQLYCVEKNMVYFVLLPNPIDFYSIENFPFMFVPLHEQAVSVAEITREEFISFATEISLRPQPNTVLFTNTARCGSTLMAKMLHHTGKSVCYGEPHALANLAVALGEKTMTEQEVEELLTATINVLRMHTAEGQTCALKTTSGEARLVPLTKSVTRLKHMFMFRKNGLKSVEKMARREEELYNLLLNFYLACPKLTCILSSLISVEGRFIRQLKPETMRQYAAIIYASPYGEYLKNVDAYSHPVVWFHDVINDTENTLRALFQSLELPEDCVSDAVKCKNVDSQKDSFLSSQKLQHIKIAGLSEQEKNILIEYAEVLQVPTETFVEKIEDNTE